MSSADRPCGRGRQFRNLVEIELNRREEDGAESGIVAPCGVRGQRRQNAPGAWIVAMRGRNVTFDERAKRISRLLGQPILQQRYRARDRMFAGLDSKSSFDAKLR